MKVIFLLFPLFLLFSSGSIAAISPQEKLYQQVVAGTDCKQSINNGLVCEIKVGKKLSFSIKDAGGADTVIGFNYSNINEQFYAVYYSDCIVVVPGRAHPRNYALDYGAYVSPKNGRTYRTKQECQATK